MVRTRDAHDVEDDRALVSVVVVNYKGVEDTLVALRTVAELPLERGRVELVVVDNASGDGSLERLRAESPVGTVVVESTVNGGFTGGCNLGARHATGRYLAFLNNDARPGPGWLAEALTVLESDASVGCVASKVLDWDGENIDYVESALTWYGMGYKPRAGMPYEGDREAPSDVLFPTGSAMIVRTHLFELLEGFDERYFMFYEDVDLGWRLNLYGHRVRYVPTSVVYHKHHQSMKTLGAYREWFLLERNALMTLYKNADDATLAAALAPAMALAVRRGMARAEVTSEVLDLRHGATADEAETLSVPKDSLTGAYAIDSFLDLLPTLAQSRSEIQERRVRTDREMRSLLGHALEPALPIPRYLAAHDDLVRAFGLEEAFRPASNVLVVTGDPIGPSVAGPAIRAMHIAQELAQEHTVRLCSTTAVTGDVPGVTTVYRDPSDLAADIAWADVVVMQGFLLEQAPWIAATDVMLVVDLYDPMHIEQLAQTRGRDPLGRTADIASTTRVLNDLLRRGDYFLVASETQRHFWLGQLAAVGRLNPLTYDQDPSLTRLVDVVPFGLADSDPEPGPPALRGRVPGIEPADKIVLWAGGIYDWFDPLTLVRAVGELATRRPQTRLYFLGAGHPNPLVPAMEMAARTRGLAASLGLLGTTVFFHDGWVPYAERQHILLDADAAVSTHFANLETTFSFRTRILDYLWAGLPMVVSEGDSFAELVTERDLGVVVPVEDASALAAALERVLYDDEARARWQANIAVVREEFRWRRVLTPLRDAVREPRRAVDVVVDDGFVASAPGGLARRLRTDLQLIAFHSRHSGVKVMAGHAVAGLRRRVGLQLERRRRPAARDRGGSASSTVV